MMDLRLPSISGTEAEQIAQMRHYLYQLVPQLQWAFNAIETGEMDGVVSWHKLGLSSFVRASVADCGRYGAGCHYTVNNASKRVTIAFNCALTYKGGKIRVNDSLLPIAYRPKHNVRSLCVADGSVATVLVTPTGEIFVESLDKETAVEWVDGFIDYFI